MANKIQCNHCGDVIESKYAHDFKWCTCMKVAVDGGQDYPHRVFESEDDFIELGEFDDD